MEALSPTSAAVEAERRAPTRREPGNPIQRAESVRGAPAIKLPLAFMLTGLAALVAGVAWFIAQPSLLASYHYNQSVDRKSVV